MIGEISALAGGLNGFLHANCSSNAHAVSRTDRTYSCDVSFVVGTSVPEIWGRIDVVGWLAWQAWHSVIRLPPPVLRSPATSGSLR
jgi:hypothetical protein